MSHMNRRNVLAGALKLGAAFSLSSAPFIMRGRAQATETISFASWGGSVEGFQKEYMIKPFTAETGIAVKYVTGPDLARVKAQVTSHNVQWDVVDGWAQFGTKEGLWEPIDFDIIDPQRFAVKPTEFAVPTNLYVAGIAHDPSRTNHPPKDFAEFWDVKHFPGRRGLRNRARETLEMALLADGVAPRELYPLDVDRAFKALNPIKRYVNKWFEATTEGTALIQRNEIDYTYTYANRVKAAKGSGVSIDFSCDQCLIGAVYWGVVRGSKHKEASMRFIEFCTRPEQQVAMVNKIGVQPAIKGTENLIDAAVWRWLPDLNNPKTVVVNEAYWVDHLAEVDKRYKEWILT